MGSSCIYFNIHISAINNGSPLFMLISSLKSFFLEGELK